MTLGVKIKQFLLRHFRGFDGVVMLCTWSKSNNKCGSLADSSSLYHWKRRLWNSRVATNSPERGRLFLFSSAALPGPKLKEEHAMMLTLFELCKACRHVSIRYYIHIIYELQSVPGNEIFTLTLYNKMFCLQPCQKDPWCTASPQPTRQKQL